MLGNEILIVLAVVALVGVAIAVLRSRSKAVGPAVEPKPLPEPKRELPPSKRADEAPGQRPAAGVPAKADEEPPEPNADTADEARDTGPRSDAETAEDGLRVAPEPASAPSPAAIEPAPEPRPARKPFFTPPPLPGLRAVEPVTKPTDGKLVAPAPSIAPRPFEPAFAAKPAEPRSAVPLPVDKPRPSAGPDAAELARREQERERYRQGLAKTRGGFVAKLARLFKSRPKVDAELRDKIEEVLLTADIGTTTAETLQARVTKVLDSKEVADPDAVWSVIRQAMLDLLELPAASPDYAPVPGPYVLLVIGVNGVGKTTTLGKLAAQHARAGRKVLLVAGDTFRAAATEQLDVWARRVGCEIHMGADKADPSSVIFEGITRGRREGFDVVLCDTAGRLHTRKELMDELAKVGRAAAKAIAKGQPEAKAAEITGAHDTFLVLDATIGQNALAQAQLFKETMGFSGLVITKLDGTAKGGVVLGVCDELRVPIRYVGIGEGIDDLRAFDAQDFVDALLADRDRAELDADPALPLNAWRPVFAPRSEGLRMKPPSDASPEKRPPLGPPAGLAPSSILDAPGNLTPPRPWDVHARRRFPAPAAASPLYNCPRRRLRPVPVGVFPLLGLKNRRAINAVLGTTLGTGLGPGLGAGLGSGLRPRPRGRPLPRPVVRG